MTSLSMDELGRKKTEMGFDFDGIVDVFEDTRQEEIDSGSSVAYGMRNAMNLGVLHCIMTAGLAVSLPFATWSTIHKAKKVIAQTGSSYREMVVLMAGDALFMSALGSLFLIEFMNTGISFEEDTVPPLFVPIKASALGEKKFVRLDYVASATYLKDINEKVTKARNAALSGNGEPIPDFEIDVDAFVSLQDIQSYTALTHPSFRSSCTFGLDVIIGKMMSTAEHVVDMDAVANFRRVVEEYEIQKAAFLRDSANMGLSQTAMRALIGSRGEPDGDYTPMKLPEALVKELNADQIDKLNIIGLKANFGDLKPVYDALLQDGVIDRLPETLDKVVDETEFGKFMTVGGRELVAKIDSLERERQLISLAASPSQLAVEGNVPRSSDAYKRKQVRSAFKSSSKSVRDQVEMAIESDHRVLATFRNMDNDKLRRLSNEIKLTAEMLMVLEKRREDTLTWRMGREVVIEIFIMTVVGIAMACYYTTVQMERVPKPQECYEYVANVAGLDIDGKSEEEIERDVGMLMKEPSNYKLRKAYTSCLTEKSTEVADAFVSVGFKIVIAAVIFLATVAGVRSHFVDARRERNGVTDNLKGLRRNLGLLVDAIDADSGLLAVNKVDNLQTVVNNVRMFKDRIPFLAVQSQETTWPRTGKIAKYAIGAIVALAALYVVVKKMQPAYQMIRMREISANASAVKSAKVSANASSTTPKAGMVGGGTNDADSLQKEIDVLEADGTSREVHLIATMLMLGVSAYTGVQLVTELFTY